MHQLGISGEDGAISQKILIESVGASALLGGGLGYLRGLRVVHLRGLGRGRPTLPRLAVLLREAARMSLQFQFFTAGYTGGVIVGDAWRRQIPERNHKITSKLTPALCRTAEGACGGALAGMVLSLRHGPRFAIWGSALGGGLGGLGGLAYNARMGLESRLALRAKETADSETKADM